MMSTQSPPDPPKGDVASSVPDRDPKADRLAEALRANLKRRKAADRARRDRQKDAATPGDNA